MKDFDVIILGAGPGGYVAAIRLAQLSYKVAIVEKENLGGICLNWGCIPTKALLKSAHLFKEIKSAHQYGISIDEVKADFTKIIERSRNIANEMQNGIQFLMKKNKIEVIKGYGKILPGRRVEVTNNEAQILIYKSDAIILATGSSPKNIASLPIDHQYIIDYKDAMSIKKQPKELIIIGAGAIGVEFAYFYQSIGTQVTIIEFSEHILPNEDVDVSLALKKSLEKQGIKIYTSSKVLNSKIENNEVVLLVNTPEQEIILKSECVLSAVGIAANLDNIGLELCNIETERDKIKTNIYCQTNVDGMYAIGDIIGGQALAHTASAEAIIAAEHFAGLSTLPIDYNNVPSCVYCSPEIASVGYTEVQLIKNKIDYLVGKFPFSASGKAKAIGETEGFVKVLVDKKYDEILGVHIIGTNATEIIEEIVLARSLEATGKSILHSIHPHPTINEAIKEAFENAYKQSIHL